MKMRDFILVVLIVVSVSSVTPWVFNNRTKEIAELRKNFTEYKKAHKGFHEKINAQIQKINTELGYDFTATVQWYICDESGSFAAIKARSIYPPHSPVMKKIFEKLSLSIEYTQGGTVTTKEEIKVVEK